MLTGVRHCRSPRPPTMPNTSLGARSRRVLSARSTSPCPVDKANPMRRPHDREPKPAPPATRPASDDSLVRIFGIHAVEAALRNPARPIRRLLLTDNAENRLGEALKSRGEDIHTRAHPREIDRVLGEDTV